MIPYFQWTSILIGPVSLQVWGMCVAVGMMSALALSLYAARARKLDRQIVIDVAFWIILSSLIGGRLIYVASEWQEYVGNVWQVFHIWEGGMSISGGFLGAIIAGVLFFRKRGIPFFPYADIIIFGLPLGLWLGRLGCFFIFDHPGKPTTFFLGQEYIDGVVRHNHGLYLSLNGLALTILFAILWKRQPHRRPGFYAVVFAAWYGVVRFFLDFLRAHDTTIADARFAGLTVAQYIALLLLVFAGGMCYSWYRNNSSNNEKTSPKLPKKKKKTDK